jgi:hypothetical protein
VVPFPFNIEKFQKKHSSQEYAFCFIISPFGITTRAKSIKIAFFVAFY